MPQAPYEWTHPVIKTTLTGRTRTRVQKWTNKLVMQVEERCDRIDDPNAFNRWRDATWFDYSQDRQ